MKENYKLYWLKDQGELLDNITTDHITPVPKILKIDRDAIKQSLLSGLSLEVNQEVTSGKYNVFVAGKSFGTGSSRENSGEAFALNGYCIVAAQSFGPIIRNNLINHGVIPVSNFDIVKKLSAGESMPFDELTKELSHGQRRILEYGGLPGFMKAIRDGKEDFPQKSIERKQKFPQTSIEKIMTRLNSEILDDGNYLKSGDTLILNADKFVGYDVFWAHVQRVLEDHFDRKILIDPKDIWLFWDHFRLSNDPDAIISVKMVQEFWNQNPGTFIGSDGIYNKVAPLLLNPNTVVAAMDSHAPELGIVPGVVAIPEGYTAFACGLACGGLTPYTVPETIKLNITGELPDHCDIKDAIWGEIIGKYFSGSLADGTMIEIAGSGYLNLSYPDASKIFNATTEFGAIGALGVESNWNVINYLSRHSRVLRGIDGDSVKKIFESIAPDENADYKTKVTIDLSQTVPSVSGPHTHKKVSRLDELNQEIGLDRIVFNSCGGTTLLDLAVLAEVIENVKLRIPVDIHLSDPITRKQAQEIGITAKLQSAGVDIALENSCGPCLGQGKSVQRNERVLSTNNRNSRGRMGDPTAEVYLSSAPVASVAAILGRVPSAEEVLKNKDKIIFAKEKVREFLK